MKLANHWVTGMGACHGLKYIEGMKKAPGY